MPKRTPIKADFLKRRALLLPKKPAMTIEMRAANR